MPNLINWQLTSTTATQYFAGTTDDGTDLKNSANNEGHVGVAIDNTNGHQYIRLWLRARLVSASTAGGYVNIWFLNGMDLGSGIVHEDGAAGTTPTTPPRPPDCVIPLNTTISTQQVVASPLLMAPPEDFKIMLVNKTGYALTNTNDENEVWYQFVDDEIQ
jgi:hypothetical protein